MTTPAQTPNGGSPLPPVPQGVGNPSGTPVMAPTRAAHSKDGATNSSLGTFGVRTRQTNVMTRIDERAPLQVKSGLAQMLKVRSPS